MKRFIIPVLVLGIGLLLARAYGYAKLNGQQVANSTGSVNPLIKYHAPAILHPKLSKHGNSDIFEEVTFLARENADSDKHIERKGILKITPGAKATILICHGFMCNKFDIGFLRFIFNDYNVFTFDLRGHGEMAENQCCTFGYNERFEVKAAAEFLKNHEKLKDQPIIAYGFSMGAVAATLAQADDNNLFTGMILDCPFDSSDNLIERALDQMKVSVFGYEVSLPGSSLLKSYAYTPYIQTLIKYFFKAISKLDATQVNTCIYPVDTTQAVKEIRIPLFIIGCFNDEKVPFSALRSIYDAAASPYKKLWLTKGDRHYDSVFRDPERYKAELVSWILKVLDKNTSHRVKQKIYYDDPTWHEFLLKSEGPAKKVVNSQKDTLSFAPRDVV